MRADIDVRFMVAKFMANYCYRLEEVLAMPFVQFCGLYHLIDAVAADRHLEESRPIKEHVKLVQDHIVVRLPAKETKDYQVDMAEGMQHMRKIRELKDKKE